MNKVYCLQSKRTKYDYKLIKGCLRTVPTNSKVFLPRFMIMQEM